jgi:DNA invertase Pin-like site-specific DNA recombinase
MRVAIYARVSTKDKQDTDNQLNQLQDFCVSQKWSVQKVYIDRVSGKSAERPAFQDMFEAASRREFDILLFWSLDRLSREGVVQTLNHLERLNGYGVGYRSFTEAYLDSTGVFREAVISILATIAKQERIRLSERVVAGLQRARKQGRIGGRPIASFDRKKALALRKKGESLRMIADKVGTTAATLQRFLKSETA